MTLISSVGTMSLVAVSLNVTATVVSRYRFIQL